MKEREDPKNIKTKEQGETPIHLEFTVFNLQIYIITSIVSVGKSNMSETRLLITFTSVLKKKKCDLFIKISDTGFFKKRTEKNIVHFNILRFQVQRLNVTNTNLPIRSGEKKKTCALPVKV